MASWTGLMPMLLKGKGRIIQQRGRHAEEKRCQCYSTSSVLQPRAQKSHRDFKDTLLLPTERSFNTLHSPKICFLPASLPTVRLRSWSGRKLGVQHRKHNEKLLVSSSRVRSGPAQRGPNKSEPGGSTDPEHQNTDRKPTKHRGRKAKAQLQVTVKLFSYSSQSCCEILSE